jgi:hypothetical protein
MQLYLQPAMEAASDNDRIQHGYNIDFFSEDSKYNFSNTSLYRYPATENQFRFSPNRYFFSLLQTLIDAY